MTVTFYPGQYIETQEHGTVLSFVEGCEEFEVNVSNTNAARLLEALGLPIVDADTEELSGQCDPSDLQARALIALAVLPEDPELPAYELRPAEQSAAVQALVGDGGARVWQGPRRAGYLQQRLTQLSELAGYCAAHDYLVYWA